MIARGRDTGSPPCRLCQLSRLSGNRRERRQIDEEALSVLGHRREAAFQRASPTIQNRDQSFAVHVKGEPEHPVFSHLPVAAAPLLSISAFRAEFGLRVIWLSAVR